MSERRQGTNAEADVSQKPKRKTRWMRDDPLFTEADIKELINDEEQTNRSLEADCFRRDSKVENSESFSAFPVSVRNRVSHLISTQKWRKMLFNNKALDAPLVVSEKIFKENVNLLLNGIDECARNPTQWSREDTDFYFNKMQSFVDSWNRQLLEEKEKIEEEVRLIKEKLDNEQALVTNRLSILTDVFDESLVLIEFSECQKKAIQSKVQEFNDVRSSFSESEQVNLALSEFSLPVKSENKVTELIEAKREAVEQQALFDKCLEVKERQLTKCRKQAEEYVHELIETENKLKETQEELKKANIKNLEMSRSKQNEMNKKLSEIRKMLMMKQSENIPNCKIENKSLNTENNDILKDIKALIEYEIELVKGNNCKTIATLETDGGSASLKVSEYEMHLVTLIASFLKVTPFPVSANYIYSYVANIDNVVDLQFVERLLKKFPSFFKQVASLPGSSEKNWSYFDLKPIITI